MKICFNISFAFLLLFGSTVILWAAPGDASQSDRGQTTNVPAPTPFTVTQRDANSRVWERTVYEADATGQVVARKHSYTELASGLHYWSNGQWLDSKEEIDILTNGTAQAVQGPHQAYFPGDIYNGVIEVVTSGRLHMKSRPVSLFYEDDQNSVIIAVLTNSPGEVVSSNQVVYPKAFDGANASIRYTYTKRGFEQDVIVQGQLPDPAALGLNPARTRLGVLTAFFDNNNPVVTPGASDAADGLSDSTLTFDNMSMGGGRAFAIGDDKPTAMPQNGTPAAWQNWLTNATKSASSKGTRTFKRWVKGNGFNYLMEEVPYPRVAAPLSQLPPLTSRLDDISTNLFAADKFLDALPRRLFSPAIAMASTAAQPMRLSRVDLNHGVVLDYVALSGASTYTFQGDTTYYVSGPCSFSAITLEGGTVIKYINYSYATAYIEVSGTVTCNTSNYRPAIFTAADDNTVGDTISGSTGYPSGNYYADPAIYAPNGFNLSHVRINYAEQAVGMDYSGTSSTLSDSQVINCIVMAILGNADADFMTLTCNNCLFQGYGVFALDEGTYEGGDRYLLNNCTLDNFYLLGSGVTYPSSIPYYIYATNCIFANGSLNVAGSGTEHGGYNGFYSTSSFGSPATTSGSSPFQTVGAGSFYLATNTFRGIGTTVIGSGLLTDLSAKTTWPPILYSNITVTTNITLTPRTPRDTNSSPDLGYHYDSLDYITCIYDLTNTVQLTINPGTAIAGYNTAGIWLQDGSSIVSIGTPLNPNWFVRYSSVQEQSILPGGNLPNNGWPVDPYHFSNAAPNGTYRFSKFACPAGGGYHLYNSAAPYFYTNLLVQDCEFWSGQNLVGGAIGTVTTLKNNLFVRSTFNASVVTGITNNSLSVSNNLFWNLTATVHPVANSNLWSFFNNDFDTSPVLSGIGSSLTINGYNAYLNTTNRLTPTNAFDIISATALAYKTGALGTFYQPTNSALINAGSTTADQVGLYHYTTQTNQLKEANSIVDIGYHYVALDANGNPIDTNGDGIPDYQEDANGNGIFDAGDLGDWVLSPYNGLTTANGFQVFTPLK